MTIARLMVCSSFCVLLAAFGCKHAVTEKDLVGQWKANTKLSNTSIMGFQPSTVLQLNGDNTYAIQTYAGVHLNGVWHMMGTKVTLIPKTLNFDTPDGKPFQIEAGRPPSSYESHVPAGPQHDDEMRYLQGAYIYQFEPAADGKTLTSKLGLELEKVG